MLQSIRKRLQKRLRKLASFPRDLRYRRFRERHPRVAATVEYVQKARLSYLGRDALLELAEAAAGLEERGVAGVLIEAGCALGGSAIVLASAKSPLRPLLVYDTFGMIPPPSGQDGEDVHARYQKIVVGGAEGIRGDRYYGYEENLQERVRRSFAEAGLDAAANEVHLIAGCFEETLRPEGPVALAHLDCDWYESVLVCLERIVPLLEPRGVLVIDDYHGWSGCRRAVDEYFGDRRGFRFTQKRRLHIVREPASGR